MDAKKGKKTAIVLAAGQGKRMRSDKPKQYLLLKGKPLLYYSLYTFQNSFVDEIILVVGIGEEAYCRNEIVEKYGFTKVKQIIAGGKERYHSVANGLKAVKESGYVFIHDGARPFLTEEILQRCYEAARMYRACVAAVPVKDTVKVADCDDFAVQTPDRSTLWQIQTPQVFETRLITEAYEKMMLQRGKTDAEQEDTAAPKRRITDDAMAVEAFTDVPVKLVQGSYENIKITTPEDMAVAEALLEDRLDRQQEAVKVFLICGKICSGKSTYAENLRGEHNAVLLSVDEIMLAVFGLYAGEKHDEYTERIQRYLFEKSVEIVKSGHCVILDWGFWTRQKRAAAREYYQRRGIACEFHYIDIADGLWKEQIDRRNHMVLAGETEAYLIDDALAAKFAGLFEPPADDEIDVWVRR